MHDHLRSLHEFKVEQEERIAQLIAEDSVVSASDELAYMKTR